MKKQKAKAPGRVDLRRSLERQRLIAAVAEVASVAPDEQTLLGTATGLIRELVPADNCGIAAPNKLQSSRHK